MENTGILKPRVLIVDDAEGQRFLLRNIVMEMGCMPVLAESGEQALKVFPRCSPAVVLLDVSMPQMDGYEVCRALKEDLGAGGVPVLFVSGFEDEGEIVKVFEAGGADYVKKPFIPEVVKARVGLQLELVRAREKLAGLKEGRRDGE